MPRLPSAGFIRADERDYALDIHRNWPPALSGWDRGFIARPDCAYLQRDIDWIHPTSLSKHDASKEQEWEELFDALGTRALRLRETIVPFPSAPIYSLHRKYEYNFRLPVRINLHSFRFLRNAFSPEDPIPPVRRLYLLHNGLNELRDFTFFYRLAALLLHNDPEAACIIRPFPGHLTRHPFPDAFAERPLDRYLSDSGELFRQYLRFMIETQWLLSIIVPRGDYRVVSGLDLLAQGPPGGLSRENWDSTALATSIYNSWINCHRRTRKQMREAGNRLHLSRFKSIVDTIRCLLGWTPPARDPAESPQRIDDLIPAIHAIGYSLGGFLAQSTFFTWPFAVSSCSTICSGGPLRDVALTAFAHREEWQTVINSVRHELASSLLDQRIAFEPSATSDMSHNPQHISGIPTHHFSCFYRIFFDVFLQEFRDSYRSRVSEYVDRMFFVVGGNDPIVPIDSLLQASPQAGLNILQIANLGHFLETKKSPWSRGFWLPRVSHILRRFTRRTEDLSFQILKDNWWNVDRTDHVAPRTGAAKPSLSLPPERDTQTGNDVLRSDTFQQELSSFTNVLERKPKGWLLILRNQVPVALLGERRLHRRGTALHYSEARIWDYFSGLRVRETRLVANQDHVTMILPHTLRHWFSGRQPVFSPKFEAAAFKVPDRKDLGRIWSEFQNTWKGHGAFREFNPARRPKGAGVPGNDLCRIARERFSGLPQWLPLLNTLPDVWIAFSGQAVRRLAGVAADRNAFESRFLRCAIALLLGSDETLLDKWSGWCSSNGLRVNDLCGQWDGWVESGAVRIVKVSAAEYNPRFLGWRIRRPDQAREYLIHAALAYAYSFST